MDFSSSEWERAVAFHGHSCPGLAIGYRAAKIALRELAAGRAGDEELVAIVETDACGVDAIQVLTGCTLGKGNLLYRDYGKHVFTIGDRKTGAAVRVALKSGGRKEDEAYRDLRARIFSGQATTVEKELYGRYQQQRLQHILEAPEEEIFKTEHVKLELPEKARLFNSVTCAYCGEPVAEVRARVKEGRYACIPCAESYSRGWGATV
ncbi:FmdE, Molybdenum formylmethanofuran dehydrogenase operon [Neomoorella glycerini]|uniref:FmdE, Molybdenum formylmethanofuran dehydrogenase operon n=1 Tax=Neomoorella glycerini TaxID=55779 RepID=A0A6I5ZWN9_9FIRM|nr:FmdE family protein [Moorella glycerini]QGP93877.1 FmdE, Molybdenum formylmethanofuran dehydrogenase operon [Moorella glycerini]